MTMEFLDQNGKALEIDDEIEYWSPSYKDWLKAQVKSIEAIRLGEYVSDDLGGWAIRPVTTVKIKVAKWDTCNSRYKSYDYLNLRKSAAIRKVI